MILRNGLVSTFRLSSWSMSRPATKRAVVIYETVAGLFAECRRRFSLGPWVFFVRTEDVFVGDRWSLSDIAVC